MDDRPICQLINIHKTIGETRILDGVEFNLAKGKVTSLLGPNGAGKTSIIRIILGLLKPTDGKVIVLGENVSDDPTIVRGQVGLLPQQNSGYKTLSGIENIKFLLNLNQISYQDEDILHLLKRLDLTQVAKKKWSVLSGGEQRSLGFIRAILSADKFIILDEPTTGLDLARAAIIRKIIQEQVQEGKTVLMSSHVITDLEELAEEIIIIKKGKIMAKGDRALIQNQFARGEELEDAIVNAFMNDMEVI